MPKLWRKLDGNAATAQISASTVHGSGFVTDVLCQRHADGSVWRYLGEPWRWEKIDDNSQTVEILVAGSEIYQRHGNGRVWRYLGAPRDWELLGDNANTVQIAADNAGLYRRLSNGSVERYDGPPMTGWLQLDGNTATVDIVAGAGALYQRHSDGSVWRYTGTPMTGWQQIGNSATSVAVCADDSGGVYQLLNTGEVQLYEAQPLTRPWQSLDSNPATVRIVAAGTDLFQLHRDGKIWQYTGHLLDIDCGSALLGAPTTVDQRRLFAIRDGVAPDEVVIYFVRSVYASSGPAAGVLNGCAAHPDDQPGAVVGRVASPWTMAHEVGHVLRLEHITGEKNSMGVCVTPDFRRAMTGCSTGGIASTPGLSGAEIGMMTTSPYVHAL